jgi:hypothetical protein
LPIPPRRKEHSLRRQGGGEAVGIEGAKIALETEDGDPAGPSASDPQAHSVSQCTAKLMTDLLCELGMEELLGHNGNICPIYAESR